jgi:O-acetyl-ADP-ribose deacetylase (regulator of RNase III)
MADVTFHLRDRGGEMVAAWERHFAGVANVLPAVGDIFGAPVDAVVSPANCFGFMDGGIDRAYCARFGWSIQDRVRELIARDWDGELPIGLAVVVETGAPDVRYLLAAPTVRAPVSVANTLNAYLSFRAVLRAIRKLNAERPGAVRTVACPGMGTGTGEMPVGPCAKQMRAAWDEVEGGAPFRPTGVNDALVQHYRLLRDE